MAEETDVGSRDYSEGFERGRSQLIMKPTERDTQREEHREIEMLDRLGIMRGGCELGLLRLWLAAHRAVQNRCKEGQ